MIRLGYDKINKMDYADIPINKAYYGDRLVHITYVGSSVQKPCFAVTDSIDGYTDREYEDVYDKTQGKWYKLNNLGEYEEYGLYGKGLDTTKYVGKLTLYEGIEYEWDGSKWVAVGEYTETIANLPDVPFTINYNAKDYVASTQTIPMTNGQLNGMDAVISGNYTYNDDHLTITNAKSVINNKVNIGYFNRSASNPNITIVSKAKTTGTPHLLSNRNASGNGCYNWMYRQYPSYLTMHFTSEIGQIACSASYPSILSVRVDSNRAITYNNWSEGTSSTSANANYGCETYSGATMFQGYVDNSGEQYSGDFYWIYMSQNTLTDDEIQQVIDFNEEGTVIEASVKYETRMEPENNIKFNSMEEALKYKCPWVGMTATIGGAKYKYTEDGWEELNQYFEIYLNNQWQESTSYGDIKDTDDYVFYESFSNYKVDNGIASMVITIDGYDSFTFKVRNDSESSWDYVVVNNLDDLSIPKWQPNQGNGLASNGYVYYTNKGKSSPLQWYDVTFDNIDGGEHKIMVSYGKDSSSSNDPDKGYIAIPK